MVDTDHAQRTGPRGSKERVEGRVGARLSVEDDKSDNATVGFVVYRYRLDGCEWNRKGFTVVDGAGVTSTRMTGLQNGLAYRYDLFRPIVGNLGRCCLQYGREKASNVSRCITLLLRRRTHAKYAEMIHQQIFMLCFRYTSTLTKVHGCFKDRRR